MRLRTKLKLRNLLRETVITVGMLLLVGIGLYYGGKADTAYYCATNPAMEICK